MNVDVFPYSMVTNHIPYESSTSQLSDDVFHMQLSLGDNLRGGGGISTLQLLFIVL